MITLTRQAERIAKAASDTKDICQKSIDSFKKFLEDKQAAVVKPNQ
jgi:hypothetical protein